MYRSVLRAGASPDRSARTTIFVREISGRSTNVRGIVVHCRWCLDGLYVVAKWCLASFIRLAAQDVIKKGDPVRVALWFWTRELCFFVRVAGFISTAAVINLADAI
jgi:hypothetical protein